MKKFILVSMLSLGLTSCGDKISGRLEMALDLLVTTTKGTKELKEGAYDFEFNATGKKSADLLVKGMDGSKHTLKFKSSANTVLPSDGNGQIFVSGIENSQNFDLVGEMSTTRQESDRIYRTTEQCSYERQRQVCYYDHYGRPYCRIEYQTVWGRREVEFTIVRTIESLSIDLKLINDGRVAGRMGSNNESESRSYHYVGQCW